MSNTYLIVGATSGIGDALARLLKEHNHSIISLSRTEEPESSHIDEHYPVDILDQAPDFATIEQPIDGLAYCPGSINLKPFSALDPDHFQQDWNLNVKGFIKTLKYYRKNLKQADQASVVGFSTVAVQTGMSFHASVSASKGAIEGIVRSLAAEWAPNIRVNAVAPSLTETPLSHSLLSNDKIRKQSEDRHPMERVGKAEDIAHAASYLLRDESSWVTGQIMHVDGGLSSVGS